jgi:peroxiredoxin Q/BCP
MNIGDKAPEILGINENGEQITLSSYAGKKIVLYFYPKDNTSGCTAEACSLRDNYSALKKAGYEVIGVNSAKAANYVPSMCGLKVIYNDIENLLDFE